MPNVSVIKPGISKSIPAIFLYIQSFGFEAIFRGLNPDFRKKNPSNPVAIIEKITGKKPKKSPHNINNNLEYW